MRVGWMIMYVNRAQHRINNKRVGTELNYYIVFKSMNMATLLFTAIKQKICFCSEAAKTVKLWFLAVWILHSFFLSGILDVDDF